VFRAPAERIISRVAMARWTTPNWRYSTEWARGGDVGDAAGVNRT
jgi:hypothetical protein